MKHRWPQSLHSQTEAVFHAVRSIRKSKTESAFGLRSFGSWNIYRGEAHKFVKFMVSRGVDSILNEIAVRDTMNDFLQGKLDYYVEHKRSRQTYETTLSALGKFTYAINHYIKLHDLGVPLLEADQLRLLYYAKSKQLLRKSSKIYDNRAFPDPLRLIAKLPSLTYQLQACLQYEGGLRSEGVGAPSNRKLGNPLTAKGLRGAGIDPITGARVGIVASVEKGGKETEHFISPKTYQRLETYLAEHEALESDYSDYLGAINNAAKETGQYATGRGSHGLKHCFAQERYQEYIAHGLSHEKALQQTSIETSHFRMRETLTYTRG